MVEMGMDLIEVQDFLDDKCIPEENPELVIDYQQDPHYLNPLKAKFVQPENIHVGLQAQGYNYVLEQNILRGDDDNARNFLPQINASNKPRLMGKSRLNQAQNP